ncbi:MAG: YgeY family selenium metabolism-linked hydrolase [Candidatus Heimdallarchaeum aukensis]|uniref:YgeY family selenium metabolism-linked hydrolase n=1 Tax=Candidatus Heimdallarchaeum aukensis TaxID=2876573 RepID=A0A9Y1BKJ1_9ARCH|nr:MAG: YgeY family selenium metabolism-linked hydrolase [Candidatus Heimdallarchaeum aukensis]
MKDKVMEKIEEYKKDMYKFLRDMIRIPSTSGKEKELIERIKQEMEKLGYDEIKIDKMGNILGRIGNGKHVIAFDAHIDTVDVGNRENWTHDPYEGYEDDEIIYGRGASDQEGGFACMVYAGKIIKDLDIVGDTTVWIVGSVQEEDCDGLCWHHILTEKVIEPEFVVLTEPTSLKVNRGQRGRMEIKVTTTGISAHGSAPERGENAIYKMAKIIQELEKLHGDLKNDEFLGKGSLTVTEIFSSSPSRCAVADGCSISVDRRLTFGETKETALNEIKNLPSVKKYNAKVEMYTYNEPSYTGYRTLVDSYFPTWVLEEDHPLCGMMVETAEEIMGKKPLLDKWTFSTNGVYIMGMHNVPCIGFGPGHEEEAHAPNEKTFKKELDIATAVYALIPMKYSEMMKKE